MFNNDCTSHLKSRALIKFFINSKLMDSKWIPSSVSGLCKKPYTDRTTSLEKENWRYLKMCAPTNVTQTRF
jgi:hypothetical protein